MYPTVEAASERLGVSVGRLDQWERGQTQPTFSQARNIADRLHIPFGYLFLSNPPPEASLPLPDLRTIEGTPPQPLSPDFLEAIHDAQRKQAWYRNELLEAGQSELELVGSFDISSSYKEIADNIQESVGIDEYMRRTSGSWEEFLRQLIDRVEDCGILVLRSGVVGNNNRRKFEVAEFRGFALADSFAPLVFINSQDSRAAQIFTLAHELSHIWINESGVSNPDFTVNSTHQNNQIERLCNRVAAEVLIPEEGFVSRWLDSDTVSNNVQRIARAFRVSAVAALRQALELGKVNDVSYREAYALAVSKQTNISPGGNFLHSLTARNSRRFVSAVISATAEERLGQIDAARLLNVKARTVESVSRTLYGIELVNA